MTLLQKTPYGSWWSPMTADLIVAEAYGLGEIRFDGDIYWTEMRPSEEGRNVIARRPSDGRTSTLRRRHSTSVP